MDETELWGDMSWASDKPVRRAVRNQQRKRRKSVLAAASDAAAADAHAASAAVEDDIAVSSTLGDDTDIDGDETDVDPIADDDVPSSDEDTRRRTRSRSRIHAPATPMRTRKQAGEDDAWMHVFHQPVARHAPLVMLYVTCVVRCHVTCLMYDVSCLHLVCAGCCMSHVTCAL